jgi:uroporphyrinogen decarboxylase
MTSAEIWRKKYREPLLTLDPKRFGDIDKIKHDYKRKMVTTKWIYYSNVLVSEILRGAMGDVVMLESMYMDPDWIKDFNDVLTNHLIMHYDWLFREVGKPDGMFIYEDMGFTGAPFFSPECQRELIMPYHKRFAGFCHDNGLPLIMHSCGKIRPFLPAIVEAGIDCLQVLEAKAGQNVAEFAKAVDNKIAFMGNLNIRAYEANDPKVLEAEILPKLDAVRKNRIPYVFHSDHSIPASVKLETYEYALHLYKRHGYY